WYVGRYTDDPGQQPAVGGGPRPLVKSPVWRDLRRQGEAALEHRAENLARPRGFTGEEPLPVGELRPERRAGAASIVARPVDGECCPNLVEPPLPRPEHAEQRRQVSAEPDRRDVAGDLGLEARGLALELRALAVLAVVVPEIQR